MWSVRTLDRNISTQYYERHFQQPVLPSQSDERSTNASELIKCYVLVDLKVGRITHQDVGQMDMYVCPYICLYCLLPLHSQHGEVVALFGIGDELVDGGGHAVDERCRLVVSG